MKVLDLFSGIGGFSLGLDRAGGFETVAFCEIEPYCRKVLAKHWPGVPIYEDVRTLTADTLARDGITVDVICGGFPCQDISVAGKGAGLEGERSGLWSEYRRIIRDVRPQWVIVENVPAILSRGGSTVTNDLAASGYDCLWECIPASAVGAPHRRDRWWCVAYATSSRCKQSGLHIASDQTSPREGADDQPSYDGEVVAYASCERQSNNQGRGTGTKCNGFRAVNGGCWPDRKHNGWSSESDVGRVAHGVPKRVDRLRGLGNAVVPQIPEIIGRAIMRAA